MCQKLLLILEWQHFFLFFFFFPFNYLSATLKENYWHKTFGKVNQEFLHCFILFGIKLGFKAFEWKSQEALLETGFMILCIFYLNYAILDTNLHKTVGSLHIISLYLNSVEKDYYQHHYYYYTTTTIDTITTTTDTTTTITTTTGTTCYC